MNKKHQIKKVDFLSEEDFQLWQKYILEKEGTNFSDLGKWRLLFFDLYGFKNYSYFCFSNDTIVGIISVYNIKSPFVGNMLVSSPFFGVGGLYYENEKIKSLLLNQIIKIGIELSVDFVELRLLNPLPAPFKQNNNFSEYVLDVSQDENTIWGKSLSSNVRQNIRKSLENNFSYKNNSSFENCFNLLVQTFKVHGTPFHNKRFFKMLKSHFKNQILFAEVNVENNIAASGLLFKFKNKLDTPYIGSLPKFKKSGANYFQYHNIIKYCKANGIAKFNFGRSPNGSTHAKFKLKWGAERIPLFYNYYVINPKKDYKTVGEPSSLFLLAAKVWRKLPLFVTKNIGHLLFRYIP